MKFKKFLDEKKKFAKAKDQDYIVDPSLVLCFAESDEKTYKETGEKTHDSAGHAIKHLGEFEPEQMKSILSNVKDEIKSYLNNNPNQFCGLLKRGGSFVTTDKDEALKKATFYILANTLDLINDKIVLKKSMVELEKILSKQIKKIENIYLQIINEKLKKSTALDNFKDVEAVKTTVNKMDVIGFDGWQSGKAMEFVIDFRDNSIIISTPDYVRTMFTFDTPAKSKSGILKNFFNKRFEVDSKIVSRALKEI